MGLNRIVQEFDGNKYQRMQFREMMQHDVISLRDVQSKELENSTNDRKGHDRFAPVQAGANRMKEVLVETEINIPINESSYQTNGINTT